MKIKTMSTFKKSALSAIILSVVTGSFISWDKYQPRYETKSMVALYQNRDFVKNDVLLQSMVRTESETLAAMTEDNLIAATEVFAQKDAENSYPLESDEAMVIEDEALTMGVETHTESEMLTSAVVIESQVLFAFDSSVVESEYYSRLNKTALLMQDQDVSSSKKHVWQIVGYTDLSGNSLYNSKLAKKRAQAVANYLVDKGVNEEQLIIISLGNSHPLVKGTRIENNHNERRVEVHLYREEVTVLQNQLNHQLNHQLKKSVKRVPASVQMAISEIRVVKKRKAPEQTPIINLKKQSTQKLTTAMKL